MMYNEKLAVAIKSAGKVLREFKDTVHMPFGREYSIFIKNLNTVRAVVRVSIDGQDVDDNNEGFVVDANDSLDIERFLKNGNLNKGNRFKFIERSSKIEEHRGIEVEDGLIRVEFQFEKLPPKVEDVHHYHHHHHNTWYPYRWYLGDQHYGSGVVRSRGNPLIGGTLTSTNAGGGTLSASSAPVMDSNDVSSALYSANVDSGEHSLINNASPTFNDAGITVPGSVSEQQFTTVDSFPLEEESHVIVLKLRGETSQGKKFQKPVTVKTKQKCPTCGHMNKATAKFCMECGTGLEIV